MGQVTDTAHKHAHRMSQPIEVCLMPLHCLRILLERFNDPTAPVYLVYHGSTTRAGLDSIAL